MDKEIKKEAGKQYLHYFGIWFVIVGILAVVFVAVLGISAFGSNGKERGNKEAPEERVYDYADVLTDKEEQKLREHIEKCEQKYHIDLVLVTINEDVESQGNWERVMMNTADDFYDENDYGFNKVHGDGVLLLDNWYEDEYGSQKGSHLSTCGIVEDRMSNYDIDKVLDAVYDRVENDPYAAYKAYIDSTCKLVSQGFGLPWWLILFLPLLIAVIYALVNLNQSPAKDTVSANAYVSGGKPVVNVSRDDFIRKNVVKRKIESNNGGSGRSGGGGHHVSRSGVSHGGGSRRR